MATDGEDFVQTSQPPVSQETITAPSGQAPIGTGEAHIAGQYLPKCSLSLSSDISLSQALLSKPEGYGALADSRFQILAEEKSTQNAVLDSTADAKDLSLELSAGGGSNSASLEQDRLSPALNSEETHTPQNTNSLAEDDIHGMMPSEESPLPLISANVEALHLQSLSREDTRSQFYDHDTDMDSALGDVSYASSMTSVTSSIYESVSENGRTYHSYKPGKYVLPNDLKEQGRLDTQHYMLCEAIGGKLFRAPLEPHHVNRVLDIATGTGIWAMEFADDFPNAEVIGTDLTPIQPRWCPPNCRFEVDDAEDEWVFTAPFSYIHGRTLMTCFKDPREVIMKCVENLEEGGWLEFQDGQVPFEYEGPNAPQMVVPFSQDEPTSVMQKWEKLTLEASIRGERPWNNVKHYKRWFEEAGLVDVTEYRSKLPLGTWDGLTKREKRIGAMQFANIYHGLEGMTLRNFARLGWTFEESKALVEDVRKEMLSRKYRPCTFSVVVMGRKPILDQSQIR